MTGERNRWLTAFAIAVYGFLFAPIVILIIFSFNDSRRTFVWRGFTTEWYGRLFANEDLLDAVLTTFQVASVAVVVSTVIGAALGLGLARMKGRGRAPAEMLLLLPMVTPEIVMGLSLLLFFLQLFDSTGSFGQLSIAHITFCISYVAITVRARAAGMNPQLEEAARDLGDSALGALWHVTLPLYIYSAIKFGVSPEINAISSIIVAVTSIVLFLAWRFGRLGRAAERRPVAEGAG